MRLRALVAVVVAVVVLVNAPLAVAQITSATFSGTIKTKPAVSSQALTLPLRHTAAGHHTVHREVNTSRQVQLGVRVWL
jgi:hypothetical protein